MDKKIFVIALIVIIIGSFLYFNITGNSIKMEDIVVIETNKGNIEVKLDRSRAPVTVDNFLKYADERFYDGTIFHRVIAGFMIQGGGLTSDGKEKQTHEPIILESNNGIKNKKFTIAMARTNVPDSATSQFFINTADNDFLDYSQTNQGYAVFGKVISGQDVVLEIENIKTGEKGYYEDWPVENIIIKRIYRKK
ncbi:MAG: peptidylprolyl isomerase [Nanoarchaeota archaeon]